MHHSCNVTLGSVLEHWALPQEYGSKGQRSQTVEVLFAADIEAIFFFFNVLPVKSVHLCHC